MRISKKAEYALRALVVMARENKSWRIEELSARENIPIKFLEQILLALRHGGLLSSKRGVGGGYALLKPAAEVSLADIVEILDGPIAPIGCAAERPSETCSCPDPHTCPLRAMMSHVRSDLSEIMRSRSIEDMLRLAPGPDTLAFEI